MYVLMMMMRTCVCMCVLSQEPSCRVPIHPSVVTILTVGVGCLLTPWEPGAALVGGKGEAGEPLMEWTNGGRGGKGG